MSAYLPDMHGQACLPSGARQAGLPGNQTGLTADVEKWLERNTFRCAVGRVSRAQCEALRARAVFDPAHPGGGPYRPKECNDCNEWRDKMEQQAIYGQVDKQPVGQAGLPDGQAGKKCSKCGEEKPLTEFYRDKKSPDGHTYRCKECARRAGKEFRARKKAARSATVKQPGSAARPALPHTPSKAGLRCALCRRLLSWYDEDEDMGFVMEHYVLPAGPVCIVCFSRLYGMKGFEQDARRLES